MKRYFSLITVAAVCLPLIQGCASTGIKSTNANKSNPTQNNQSTTVKCQPFEKFIQTPNGGTLISGTDIIRDSNGNITTKWKTTFPAGTQANVDLGLWKPDKKNDSYGPSVEASGGKTVSSDGSVMINAEQFTNGVRGYSQGQYYAYLILFSDEKRPVANDVLRAALGKIRAVSEYSRGGSLMFELVARFDLPACADLPVTTAPTPRPTMTKAESEAVARRMYANILQNKMSQRGTPVEITVSGEDNTTITVQSSTFTRESVMSQLANAQYVAPFRKAHFKRLEFTDGVSTWGIDLR